MKKTIFSLLLINLFTANATYANPNNNVGGSNSGNDISDIVEKLIQKGYGSGEPLVVSIKNEKVAELGVGSKLNWDESLLTTLEIPAERHVLLTRPGSKKSEVLEEGKYDNIKFSKLEYMGAKYLGSTKFVLDYKASPQNNDKYKPSCLNVFIDMPYVDRPIKLNDTAICVGKKETLLTSDSVKYIKFVGDELKLRFVSTEGIDLVNAVVKVMRDDKFLLKEANSIRGTFYSPDISAYGMKLVFKNKYNNKTYYSWTHDSHNILKIFSEIRFHDFYDYK